MENYSQWLQHLFYLDLFLLLCSLKPSLIKMMIKMILGVQPLPSLKTALFHDSYKLMMVYY